MPEPNLIDRQGHAPHCARVLGHPVCHCGAESSPRPWPAPEIPPEVVAEQLSDQSETIMWQPDDVYLRALLAAPYGRASKLMSIDEIEALSHRGDPARPRVRDGKPQSK